MRYPQASAASEQTFNPSEDTFASEPDPNTTLGGLGFIVIKKDNTTLRISYLKFDCTSFPRSSVSEATLRLVLESNNLSSSDKGVSITEVTDKSWDEDTLTFNNRPALDGELFSSFAVDIGDAVGTVYEVNLLELTGTPTNYINKAMGNDKILSFGFNFGFSGNEAARFYSKEEADSSLRPLLTLK